jgi:vacuolar-type H+-ATPase subunit E/Vma4
MATLQELAASIAAQGMSAAQQIDLEAQTQLQQIDAETERLVSKRREQLYAQTQQQEQELKARLEAKAKLEAMQQILRQKQQLIDETFSAAEATLRKLDGAQRKSMLQKLWQNAAAQIKPAQVITTKQDASFFRGKKVKITLAEGLGGFIAITSDKKLQVDLRFETLLAEIRARHTAEVSNALWGGK